MDACLNTMETDSSPNFSFRNSDPYYQSGAVPFVNTYKVEAENQRRPCLPYIPYQNIDPPPPPCKTSETLWKYPEYVYFKERLASFKDWPKYLKGPSKKDLARAGVIEQTFPRDVVQSINNTPNRSLNGRTPASVNKDNEEEVRLDSYLIRRKSDKVKTKTMSKPKPYTLKIGDQVRITHLKRVFQRDYDQTYTEEVFIIKSRHISQDIPIYKLVDMMDEPILGSFYANELQKVTKDENTVWRIEKILKERKTKDRTEVKVRWAGWPNKFDSWIAKGDIKDT
ncbi:hypothetical protein FSP39_001501 [Pinctada imbricata]|uniref:Chromo domain-containing protein n=1 Tax=Pinctada imbricata TaxID=66713 RepID=A0AA88YRD8_PINIB|nr:hypothetical protein FSP39_001501 [Pinctada imbricata]